MRIDSPTPAIAAEEAGRYWEFMRPSFEYGGMDYSEKELREETADGSVLLIRIWMGDDLASVSAVRVRETYGIRDLMIMATAGHMMPEWIDNLDDVLMELAKETECDTITVQTREGMGKISKRRGYKVHQVIIRKTVRPIQ